MNLILTSLLLLPLYSCIGKSICFQDLMEGFFFATRSAVNAGPFGQPTNTVAPVATYWPRRGIGHGLSLSGRGYPRFRCHGVPQTAQLLCILPSLAFLFVHLPGKTKDENISIFQLNISYSIFILKNENI